MSQRIILLFILLLALIAENTILNFPFVYLILLMYYILFPDLRTVSIAFITGILLDSLKLSPIGFSPLIIMLSFAGIEILKKIVEFNSLRIILPSLFIATFIAGHIYLHPESILIYIVVFLMFSFYILYFNKRFRW